MLILIDCRDSQLIDLEVPSKLEGKYSLHCTV
jgi:hypothetical protein